MKFPKLNGVFVLHCSDRVRPAEETEAQVNEQER